MLLLAAILWWNCLHLVMSRWTIVAFWDCFMLSNLLDFNLSWNSQKNLKSIDYSRSDYFRFLKFIFVFRWKLSSRQSFLSLLLESSIRVFWVFGRFWLRWQGLVVGSWGSRGMCQCKRSARNMPSPNLNLSLINRILMHKFYCRSKWGNRSSPLGFGRGYLLSLAFF